MRQNLGLSVSPAKFWHTITMEIIANNEDILQSFWLYFQVLGNGVEWIDYDLPVPTLHKHLNRGYVIGWAIEGYFATESGQEFVNDIIARFLISFKEQGIKRLPYKPKKLDDKTAKIYAKIYKLREFSRQLESLPAKKLIPKRADSYEDFTFWAIKLYSEDMIRETGFIVYDSLENWALSQFEHKERSTIRAKCRSVWNWYYEKDFKLPQRHKKQSQYLGGTMATRQEHMRKVSKNKAEKNRKAVINLITGLYAEDYKKKSGSWHLSKIAKDLHLNRETVSKIVRAYEESKIGH